MTFPLIIVVFFICAALWLVGCSYADSQRDAEAVPVIRFQLTVYFYDGNVARFECESMLEANNMIHNYVWAGIEEALLYDRTTKRTYKANDRGGWDELA